MFKSLQSTIFCFAAVILAIILIASACSDNKKKAELNSQLETLNQQIDTLSKEKEKAQQELEATKVESKLLSDQVKAETERSQKYAKKLESLATVNVAQKEQLENAKKQIADMQGKLLVARQLATNAANPQEIKKLETELKAVKDDLANKNIQLNVLMPQSRKLAEQLLETRKQLEAATASKAQQPKSGQTQPKKK
jgi:outer membrane murein-binding lipoprotein Lpp